MLGNCHSPHSRAAAECLAAVPGSLIRACLGLPPLLPSDVLGLGKSALSNSGGEQEHGLDIMLTSDDCNATD